MGNFTNPNRWDAQQRLTFVEQALWWRGWLQRSDLVERFGISLAQASADIAAYAESFPHAMSYQPREKRYVATGKLRLKFSQPDLASAIGAFLGTSNGAGERVDRVATVDLPGREMKGPVVRTLFQAVLAERPVDVVYFSVHGNSAKKRRVLPHAFAFDGYRWHVRAYCTENQDYRDFVIGRMASCEISLEDAPARPVDRAWKTWRTLTLRASRKLEAAQRTAIEMDYGMKGGQCTLRVREAMLGYTLAYLNLAPPATHLEMVGAEVE